MKRLSYRISRVGSINNIRLVEEELIRPNDNEVTVEIKSIGLNFADVFTILGLYKASPRQDFIPGLEFSGVIVDKGCDVNELNTGDRVMGVIRFGAYTSHLNIDQRYVIKIPDDWTFEEGASFIVQALTAYYALIPLGNLVNDQTVLIHSAAGGVGIYANRIAKKFSAFTIGTIGNSSKINLLKSEGYDRIIVRNTNFKKELIEALNGRRLDLILEVLGGTIQKESFDLLAPMGRMIVYGSSTFVSHSNSSNYLKLGYQYIKRPKYDSLSLIESNKSIMGFNLIWLYNKVDLLRSYVQEIMKLNLKKPYIGHVYEFNDLIQAVKKFKSGLTTGKVVVRID